MALEDTLLRIFAGERINRIMVMLTMPEGEAIERAMVTPSIESALRGLAMRATKTALRRKGLHRRFKKIFAVVSNDVMRIA